MTSRTSLRGTARALALAAVFASPAAAETLPSMKSLAAPLISPAAGEAFYGASLTHTSSFAGVAGFEGQPPEIVETARSLKNDPDLIHEFVRNHVRVEYAYGLRKGPLAALIDKSGTPFDQNVLFVNLVRQAGLPARYQLGRVTMTGADFANWTGVSDLQAACRLLAAGGIPAAFNGAASSASDCALSGAFTSVTLLHVWSQVQIGGTWYAFDPSIKTLTASPGRNLVTGSGLVAGQPATQAASTISTGTQSGSTYIQNASQTNLDSYLTARGTQLQSDLTTNATDQDTADVVGLKKIVPQYKPAGGWRNATPPGYVAGASTTIAGDIPDQYRASLRVTISAKLDGSTDTNLIDRLLYADDIGGRRVGVSSNFLFGQFNNPVTTTSVDQTYRLTVDGVAVGTFTCTASVPILNYPCPLGQGGTTTLAVKHPYAAEGEPMAPRRWSSPSRPCRRRSRSYMAGVGSRPSCSESGAARRPKTRRCRSMAPRRSPAPAAAATCAGNATGSRPRTSPSSGPRRAGLAKSPRCWRSRPNSAMPWPTTITPSASLTGEPRFRASSIRRSRRLTPKPTSGSATSSPSSTSTPR